MVKNCFFAQNASASIYFTSDLHFWAAALSDLPRAGRHCVPGGQGPTMVQERPGAAGEFHGAAGLLLCVDAAASAPGNPRRPGRPRGHQVRGSPFDGTSMPPSHGTNGIASPSTLLWGPAGFQGTAILKQPSVVMLK